MNKWTAFLGILLLSTQLDASAVEITGSIPVELEYNDLESSLTTAGHKVIVQQLRLSPAAQQILSERLDETALIDAESFNEGQVATYVDLGMNRTPVLNQGVHGSCVTFATTAAIDAIIGKGDYISQLCSLELGAYLYHHNMTEYSGWDGSLGTVVLNQYQDYGLITKKYQYDEGCAGVKRYPTNTESNTGKLMPISEYIDHSFPLANYARWEILVDPEEAFSKNHNPTTLLRNVRKQLREEKRIVFGVLLDLNQKNGGALGSYQKPNDSWILTNKITNNIKRGKINGGHQMLIIGYDDQAVITDQQGKTHKGLLIIRNSWGSRVGHFGNYYMSYSYFKAMCDEAQVIIPEN